MKVASDLKWPRGAEGDHGRDCCNAPRTCQAAPRNDEGVTRMYIVIIAWLYVVVLMALAESSLTMALLTLFGYGLLPLAVLVWIVGGPKRRSSRPVHQLSDQPDGPDSQRDE
jgi:hypothetical protein